MKKTLIITGIIISILLLIILLLMFWFWFIFGGGSYFIQVPKPEITYGEFPFRLKYEINGKIETIEDTLVCEFDGFNVEGENGKYRKWKTSVKSTGKDMITLYDLRKNNDFTDWGNQVLELCFDPGNGEYYMGDTGDRQRKGSLGTWIDYLYLSESGKTGYSAFKPDEAWEKYNIKIISWEIADPIQNNFK